MIAGLDSATPPSADQVAAARAAGVSVWSGYLQTKGGVGLYRAWSQAEFDVAKACGGTPIAYASGWDNPLDCRALAATWGVRLCLDVESGIRGDGPWVQPWLDESGAGLYGNRGVFNGRRAAFYIMAGYYGSDPGTTWPAGLPSGTGPRGWQWQGTHDEFGVGVDSSWLDDFFAQGDDLNVDEHNKLYYNTDRLNELVASMAELSKSLQYAINDPRVGLEALYVELDALKKQIAALPAGGAPVGGKITGTISGTLAP